MIETSVRGAPAITSPVPLVGAHELPEPLAERLAPRMQRLGYLGAFFAYAAHQPDALAGFIDFTESLKKTLPVDLAEVVALSVAGALHSGYELAQHKRLATRLGLADEWVGAVLDGPPDVLDAAQTAVRDLTSAVLAHGGHRARPPFERVVNLLGPADAIGVLLLIGRYVAHAHVANTLELTDPARGMS